jgi:putative transposase
MQVLRKNYGSEIDVEIRVMDDNLGSIIVVSPDESQLISVPAVDQRYAAGLTRWQHEVCKRYKRRLYENQDLDITLFDAKERIRLLIKKDQELIKRASRKRQARFNETIPVEAPAIAEPATPTPVSPAASTRPVETPVDPPPMLPVIPTLRTRRVAAN